MQAPEHNVAVAAAEDSEREADSRSRVITALPLLSVEEIIKDESLQSNKWLVQDLIPRSALSVIFGQPKTGKSTLAAWLSAAVVSGNPFLGREVKKGPVLWINLETTAALAGEVLHEAGASSQEYRVHVFSGAAPNTSDLLATVAVLKPSLVVIDSLSRLLQLRDEDRASGWNTQLESSVLRIAREHDSAVVAIHHSRKKEGQHGMNMRGSSALLAVTDLAIELGRAASSTEDASHRQLSMTGRYPGVPEKLNVVLKDTGYELSNIRERYIQNDELLQSMAQGEFTAEELAKHHGLARQSMLYRLSNLLKQQLVSRSLGTGQKGNPHRYFLPRPSEMVVA